MSEHGTLIIAVPLEPGGYNAGPHKIRTFKNQHDVTK